MKKFKIVALLIIMAMCISMFAGCNKVSEPKNAVDLVKRSSEAMKGVDNYHADISMSMSVHLDGDTQGISMVMSMPMDMEMSFDRAGNFKHGFTEMEGSADIEISFMGESEKQSEDFSSSSEMYAVLDGDEVTTYTNEDDSGWVYTVEDKEDNTTDMGKLLDADGDDNIFVNAEMEKEDNRYVVTLKLADALKNEDFIEFVEDGMFSSLSEDSDFDWDEFADAVGDAKIVYVFDAETWRVTSISVKKVELDDISFMSGFEGMDFDEIDIDEMSMTMDIEMKLSKFGKIDPDDAEVPKKVKRSAVKEEEFEEEDDSDDLEDDPVEVPDVDVPTIPEGPAETEPVIPNPSIPSTGGTDEEYVFIYNGFRLGIPIDYTVFLNDGWYAVEDGEYSSFLCMENKKYEYLTLYVYTEDGSGTEESVAYNGGDGFELDIYQDTVNPPNLTFAGIEFGDSREDVVSVLGEPEETYSSSDFEYLVWGITYIGEECTLEITLINGEVTGFDLRPGGYF